MEKKKLTVPQIIFTAIFLILGILCLLYGITIMMIRSGSIFFTVWYGLAGIFHILAAITAFRIIDKIPVPLKIIISGILAAAFLFFLITQILVLSHFGDKAPKHLDYVIVLGAQMKTNGPSVILQYRLDCAIDYLKENPDTICIVSGGKGPNEPVAEGDGMKEYLIQNGIPAERILVENKSSNTIENILYSKELLKSESSTVGIVTNNFHLYRAYSLAKKQIANPIYGISAYSNPVYLPNNMLRESIGIVKDVLHGNMRF